MSDWYHADDWHDPPKKQIRKVRGEMAIDAPGYESMRFGGPFTANIQVESHATPEEPPTVRVTITVDPDTIIILKLDDSATREVILALYECGDFSALRMSPGGIGLFVDEMGNPLDRLENEEGDDRRGA